MAKALVGEKGKHRANSNAIEKQPGKENKGTIISAIERKSPLAEKVPSMAFPLQPPVNKDFFLTPLTSGFC